MTKPNKAQSAPMPFADPNIEGNARKALNSLVLGLLKRTVQPLKDRAPKLATLAVVEEPALFEHILRNPQVFQKNFALVAALGESRFNLNGERWEMFRDRTQKAYNQAGKPTEHAAIAEIYEKAVNAFDPSNVDNFETLLNKAAIGVFARALRIEPDIEATGRLFPEVRTHAKLLQYFSWSGISEPEVILERTNWMDEQFNKIFTDDPLSRDFIQQSIAGESIDEWFPAITDLMQNLFAGAETTVATLCWAIRLVGQNQELQDNLRAEALSKEHDKPLMRSFLSEVMRCVPPIPFVVRELTEDYEGHGRRFKKGEQVILSIIGLHKHPDAWENPNQFHARRSEFAPSSRPSKAFRPFLSGPRVCGGKRLAELEMMIAMGAVLQKWQIMTSDKDIGFEYALAMQPASLAGVKVVPVAKVSSS
jgi:cytochrome P450